jgi:catechol 2,3-dioxygenase-like lactoylglutathione lyase family enzyme
MTWATKLAGVTLVQERLDQAKAFYSEVFELQAAYEDERNVVFKIDNTVLHLLDVAAAPDLIGPGPVAAPSAAHRAQLAVQVDDVDALCRQLAERGVRILSGPLDRPWGIRTANFEDPGRHLWEVWTDLP